MGMIQNGAAAGSMQAAMNTKKLRKLQEEYANASAANDALVLEHLEFQSQALADIRDLLKAQQQG